MDDEDSQEELINRRAAPGKKSALTLVSDEEEEEESDETGSEDEESGDNGEEEEEEDDDEEEEEEEEESEGEAEDVVDGSDSSVDEDDEAECDNEEDEEELESAVGGADCNRLATNGSRSSDEEGENCPICLNAFRGQAVGTPENCNHYFCLDCIVEWAKNANSCPVDRIAFSCICIRAHFGGDIIKKVPVENHAAKDSEEEEDDHDTTNCEVCGRCDREDRLLLCDGCDAGYHMECLDPPLNAIPVDEWFCPGCAVPNPSADEEERISEAEVSSLIAEVQPVASRLRTSVRTRAIARTRQSERVRENVNRLRTRTANRNENVPRYLTTSVLDETIEAVVAGMNTAVYQRPLHPRATTTRRKKTGRRRKGTSKTKSRGKVTTGSWMTGKKTKKRRRRFKRRKGRKIKAKKDVMQAKKEVSSRTRIANTLGLCKPVRGVSIPAVRGSVEPSLGLLRSDIGAASLSVFGDRFALDPYDSQEEQTTGPPSPMSTKRRILSRSALRSHQPVARPISVGLSRRAGAAIIREHVEPAVATPAPVSDLLGSILFEQNRLMMSSSDIVINRDGSLLARKSANTSSQKSGSAETREGSTTEDNRQGSSSISGTSSQTSSTTNTETPTSSEQSPPIRPPSTSLFPISPSYSSSPRSLDWILNPISKKSSGAVRLNSSFMPRAVQVQNIATAGRLGLKPAESPRFNGNNKRGVPSNSLPSNDGNSSQSSTSRGTSAGHPPEPGAKRIELSDLPRIPKIKREVTTEHHETTVGKGGTSISDAFSSRLIGKGESRRPSRFSAIENSKHSSSKDPQETFKHVGSVSAPNTYSGSTVHTPGDKGSDSTALSAAGLKITINPGAGPCNRLFSPSTSSPFRPVESKSQTKPDPSPNCHINKKEKLVKNEIYDPFDPTGSNSSSACSSPEREEPSLPVPEHIQSSPDVALSSPVTLNSPIVAPTSPVVAQASPDISRTSPDVAQTSPDIAWMIPEVTRAVQDAPKTAPDITRTVPEVIRTVPEISRVFPEVTRVFTEVTRVVPEVNRTFTEVTRKFPEVTRNVPEVKMTFPKVTMKLPDATTKFSDVSRKFPEVTRKFPEINRTFPEVTRTFPEVTLKFPEVTRKLPEVGRTFPEVTSKLPDLTRTFPGISRAVPEVTRTFPSDPTKPGAFRSFRLLTTSTKLGVSGLGSDFSDTPPTKTIHRDVVFEEPIKDDGPTSEGDKDLKGKDTEIEKKGGKESYKNFHASVTVTLSPERTKSAEVSRLWHDKEERTLVSVKSDPDVSAKNKPQKVKRPFRDTKSRSRSRSNSSSHSRKKHKKEKKLLSRERKKKRSRSRSRSQSREQNSRSASWSTEEEPVKKSRHKNKGKRLSSDHSSSSSHERLKKKKIKEIKKSKKKSSSSKDRRKTRSSSVSHGSSSSEFYESKKKKKRKSRSRERSRSSSVDREKRRKRKSEKNYDRYDKEGTDLRFRERRRSKEKKKGRSISPQMSKESKRARSKEKWQAPKDRTVESKETQLSPHRVVKLTGTYEENIPKLTVSYVDNVPRRTVHSLVVNPDAKEPLKFQRQKDFSDTSLETDSDLETSDEENELKDAIQQPVFKEVSSEAVSPSGENESTPCQSPDHLYSPSRLDATDSVGSGIDCMHSGDVTQEITTVEGTNTVQASSVLKCSDKEVVLHSPAHTGVEVAVSNDVEQSVLIEKGEEDDVDKMLDDNLNLVHSVTVLSEVAQNKMDGDSENQFFDGTQEKLGNCELYQSGFSAPDKLIEDVHAKCVVSAPIKSSEVLHDKPGFCTLQLGDDTDANDSETDTKLGVDADSDVDDELKKDEKQKVDRVVEEVENVEDNALVEGVADDLLDAVSLQQVANCTSEQVNSFSGNQEGFSSHDQPSNLHVQDYDCSAGTVLDGFSDKKNESSVHGEDFVCRSDSFVGSGVDEFVDRVMDRYSGHVADGDASHKGDRFADHPVDEFADQQVDRLTDHHGDRLTDHHVDEFSGHQIVESDDLQEEKFEDQRMGDFGGRSMEEFASYLLEKFAGHGIGDFTSKVTDVGNQVTDVASNQVTIIPGIGMGDVTDYQEDDTVAGQDDDDDDDYAGEQSEMELSSQSSALKSKQQVKRVTWNLQEEDSDTSTSEKTSKVPFYKLLRSKEEPWKAFDALSQTSNTVHSPDVPLTPPLPSSLPPFTPVSEPSAHYIMQESLPLLGCVAGSTVTSELGNLATASEPGTQSASTGDVEEKTMFQKPSLDRITQEYLKKLHIQERAVEEVKLAIKPFYQTREITKDEYKDILRKAVSKICHSKSGEINPVKVANLIKAYVERYKHLRKHKREIEYHDMDPESP